MWFYSTNKNFRMVHHAEVKHDFYFLRSRPRKVTETIDFSDYRQRKKLKNNQKS